MSSAFPINTDVCTGAVLALYFKAFKLIFLSYDVTSIGNIDRAYDVQIIKNIPPTYRPITVSGIMGVSKSSGNTVFGNASIRIEGSVLNIYTGWSKSVASGFYFCNGE